MSVTATKKVLIVDDDPDVLDQVALILEGAGHEVARAESAAEAEELLLSVRPDLAVVDVMMEHPDSGIKLCHDIRRLHPDAPIILLTAVHSATGLSFKSASPQAQSWIKADLILDKPVHPERLCNEVRRLLEQ